MRSGDVYKLNESHAKPRLFILFFAILMCFPFIVRAEEKVVHINTAALDRSFTKKVLVLNSYHQGHPWTDGITKGIIETFAADGADVEIHIENLDTKRITNRDSWNEILRNKLDSYPPDYLDLMIVADDNALYSLYKIGHQYHKMPIVYCSVSEDITRHMDTCSMIIGVEEYLPFKENIELGLKLFPNTEHIAIVTDHSRTGASHYLSAKHAIKKMDLEGIEIIWLNAYARLTTEELQERLRTLPENTFVVFSIWQVDQQGRFWDPNKYYPEFAQITNVPIFTVKEIGVSDAFLGGMVTSAETQGRLAAQTGIQLLNGKLIEDLPRLSDENKYYFNWAELNKWNIKIKDLPKGSIILNKPQTVYSQYQTFFFLTLSLIILMFVMFWILLLYHFRYRNYEAQRTDMANKTKQLANRYKILFEQSNNAIVIFELESSVVIAFNEKALDLFGTPRDVFQDYELKNYFDNYLDMKENINDLLKAPFEMQMYTWERNVFQAQVILNLLIEEEKTFVYSIINDISLRKEQEKEIKVSKARLNQALLNSKNSYWEWDLVNNELHKDDNFWLALGIDPTFLEEDPIDSNYYLNSVYEEDKIAFVEQVNDAILGKKDTILHELRMSFFGKETWVEVRGVVDKRDENGRGLNINGFMMNIDERKRQEEELIKAKEKAEESDRLKSAFISNISHEIRTPLNGIVGFSNLLGRENLTLEEKRKYLSFINQNNDLLLKLINDILEISRIETDSISIHTESCNLQTLCDNILSQESLNLAPTVSLELDEVPNISVQTDKMRLTQILKNLLSNAVKFTDEGKIVLGYTIKRDMIEFYISDTGIGIEKVMLNRVFERFFQVDPFSSGTGLGLSISKAIAEKMGGRIWLESEPGKGTTAYFSVKYRKAKIDIAEIEPVHPTDSESKEVKATEIGTILIAEDDESSFVLLDVILKGKYKVIRALNEEDILLHMKRFDPDILIVDMYMPGFTEETVSKIKEINDATPIIGLSDNTLDFIKNKEIADSLDDHLSKPINIKSLMEILENKLNDE